MPVRVVKKGGTKPYKIVESATGEVKGSSKTKQDAEASARIRNIEHWKNKASLK